MTDAHKPVRWKWQSSHLI